MDISFRIDDSTVVRATAATPVEAGSQTFRTDAVRDGQTVTVDGRRTNGFLDATKISIIAQAPE
jgi:phosphohistidine swiveling domain-containing protein